MDAMGYHFRNVRPDGADSIRKDRESHALPPIFFVNEYLVRRVSLDSDTGG